MKKGIVLPQMRSYILTYSVIILIASTLIFSRLFIHSSLTPLYGYSIGISLLLILSAIFIPFLRLPNITVGPIVIIIVIWALFIAFHGQLVNGRFSTTHFYLIVSCALFVTLWFWLKSGYIHINLLFKAICIIAMLECLICIGQYFGLINSLNSYFDVTGTWENPNVTAMFITMAIPPAFSLFRMDGHNTNKIAVALIALFIIVILLLKCRTALIGVCVTSLILLNKKFKLVNRFKDLKSQSAKILLTIMVSAFAAIASGYFYQAKKASADGRKLIWKLSSRMVLEKPWTGYGYGTFSKNYNHYQSAYFKAGNGTIEEVKQAGFVHMGYNEFLQNTVEGGLGGLVIICGLFAILIGSYRQMNNVIRKDLETSFNPLISYSGVSSFIVMSFFNFSLQAVPAMCLFIVYGSMIAACQDKGINLGNPVRNIIGSGLKWGMAFILIIFGTVLGIANIRAAYAGLVTKYAESATLANNPVKAVTLMESISLNPYLFENYFITYGDALLKLKKYSEALTKFNAAKSYSSDPNLFLKSAVCYDKTGQYNKAQQDYLCAVYIEPNRLVARTALMNLYDKLNDTTNAVSAAKEILSIQPKKYTAQAVYDKQLASEILKKLGVTTQNRQTTNTPFIFTRN